MPAWVQPALDADDPEARAVAYSWCRSHGYDVVAILQERYAARRAAIRAQWLARPAEERDRIAQQWRGDDAAA